jgi:5'-nucleotidase
MVRSRQTNYGLLAARSFAAALPGADVYLLNSGSIRVDDKLSGRLTEYDVLRSFPFGGGIVRTQWPGSVLARVLEAGSRTNFGKGGYLQLYQASPQPDGSWLIGGQPLDEQRSYTVVLPEFVAQGNEANLQFLSQYPYEKPATVGNNLRNDVRTILIAWMEQQGRF